MSFRDDHDATLARAEALERELTVARERLADTTTELSHVGHHRAELEAEVLRLRALLPRPPRPPARERTGPLTPRDWVLGLSVGLVPVIVMLGIISAAGDRAGADDDDDEPAVMVLEEQCTLRSDPPGATVHELAGGARVGETPMTRTRSDWNSFAVGTPYYELRLDGYRTAQVPPPLDRSGCDDRVLELQPLE